MHELLTLDGRVPVRVSGLPESEFPARGSVVDPICFSDGNQIPVDLFINMLFVRDRVATTYGDLGGTGRYDILVRVRDVSPANVPKRAFELQVEDVDGTQFPFVVWEKSTVGRSYDWQEGCWYHLKNVTANCWSTGKVLHGTSALEVEAIGSLHESNEAQVLYFTDSHLGKKNHSYGGKSWGVTPQRGFNSAIDTAISTKVDAVIHGGDLFHNARDGISTQDIKTCRKGLRRLAEAGIPFLFIYGNHERRKGRRILQDLCEDGLAVHLGSAYEPIGDNLVVYGVDFQSDWDKHHLDLSQPPSGAKTILCLHQSIAPFTARKDPVETLDGIRKRASTPLDVVITGHTHTRSVQNEDDRFGLSGGSSTRVGKSRNALDPSAELISFTGGELSIEQHLL